MSSSTPTVPTRKQRQDFTRDRRLNRRRSLVRHSNKLVAFAALSALVLFAQTGGRAAPGEAPGLPFFASFSVTGGYKVAGVDLKPGNAIVDPDTGQSFVTGTIQMSEVPPNADIAAAYLYWETITNGDPAAGSVGAQFRGQDITVEHAVSMASNDLQQAFSPCWTSGGGGANLVLTMYRADVLQLLAPQFDSNGISTGRRLANGDHIVKLPEAGTGNQSPQSAGASLLVVYRNPKPTDPSAVEPLTRVVVYDGLSLQTQGTAFAHTIRGFFDAANSSPVISMTHIVGSGADNNNDRVTFNGTAVPPKGQTSTLNPFKRTSGGTSDRGWSNPTFENLGQYFQGGNGPNAPQNVQNDSTYGEWVTTGVNHGGQDSPNDCLAWAAIVFSTTGQDQDGDGLLDKEEEANNTETVTENNVQKTYVFGFKDPNGVRLPPLARMGALKTKRDMFVEIAAMKAAQYTHYGSENAPFSFSGVDCGDLDEDGNTTEVLTGVVTDCAPSGHNHMPSPVSLGMLGQQFAAAPADARYSSAGIGIALHFDVGNPAVYRALFNDDPLTIPDERNAADAYLVGNGNNNGLNDPSLAQGGTAINEGPCGGPCPFPDYPGTVTWKTGFGLYKEAILDPGRERYFRFGLYAHAKGTHKSPFPCLDDDNNPTMTVDGECSDQPNPKFYVPGGISGSADFPGGDYMVTLGFFDNVSFVGSDFVVASTTMHELGHTIGLGHGGDPVPNCKPIYPSVMNYMYQLGGLVDIDGIAHLGYSSNANASVNEGGLTDTYAPAGSYRVSWYAPLPTGDNRKPATRFCSGQSFDTAHPPGNWIRVDGLFNTNGTPKVDWNANGSFDGSGIQDVNFDGIPAAYEVPPVPVGAALTDYDDWGRLRLNQVGAARSTFAFSAGSTLRWDGTTITGDGTTITGDGTTITGDGTTITGDGTTITGDGTLITADGTTITGDGTTITGDGTTLTADGAVTTINGTTITGDGTTITGDGTTITGDGNLLLPNGVTITGDGVLITADGVPKESDNSALSSNHNEVSTAKSAESGNLPGPQKLTVCIIGVGGCADPGGFPAAVVTLHRHRLDFLAPTVTVAPVASYTGYRKVPGGVDKPIGTTPNASQLYLVDTEELPQGQPFTYYVVANLNDGNVTGRSNDRLLPVARNDPPTVTAILPALPDLRADTYTSNPNVTLTVSAALGVLANDKAGADSYPTALKAVKLTNVNTTKGGKVSLNEDGSFTYTPKKGTSGTDTFFYKANNGPWSGNTSIPLSVDSGSVTVSIVLSGQTP
jgi:hypothetical protein